MIKNTETTVQYFARIKSPKANLDLRDLEALVILGERIPRTGGVINAIGKARRASNGEGPRHADMWELAEQATALLKEGAR
jgi:hypothetical protein